MASPIGKINIKGEDPDKYRDEVMERMKKKTELAKKV